MHWVDWTIVLLILFFLVGVSVFSNRYVKSVSDFLTGGRCAGRYLLAISEGAAGFGAISMIAAWQMYYKAGFSVMWWQEIAPAIVMVLALSGWIVYRYRQTRVMTLAQFLEVRYSRNLRVFGGLLAWVSGIVNYGIFPVVTARCIIYFCGIPVHTVQLGALEINITIAIVMAVMLTIAVCFTLLGGQIAIMVSDMFQGQFFNIVFLIVLGVLLFKIGWADIIETLKQRPENESMLNPFKTGKVADFNMVFFLMSAFLMAYGYKAWQGVQGYNCAAKSPHEARMATILAVWRDSVVRLMLVIAPICAYVVINNPKFGAIAAVVNNALAAVTDEKIQSQMTVAITLKHLLPVGLTGLLAASIIAAAVSSDDTCLHSWGSIFIQDVVMPFRKKPLSPKTHLKLLRYAVIGVAIFAWTFSMIFPLKEYIYMFFSITGAIYIGGAGSAIIGGLYWKRGTTAGAWAGMITGSILSVSGVILNNIIWPFMLPKWKEAYQHIAWLQRLPDDPVLNGVQVAFLCALLAIFAYVFISLLTKPDPDFDMDKMLHRGKYANKDVCEKKTKTTRLARLLGISSEFTKIDKLIYFSSIAMGAFWFLTFVIGSILYHIFGASEDTWSKWWLFKIVAIAVIACMVTVWFLIGGIRDLIELFRTLRTLRRNELDNGSVIDHQNLADIDPKA